MINVHSAVKRGSMVNQGSQYEISEMIVRGGVDVTVLGATAESGEEISSGMEIDFPSFIDFCRRVLVESKTLPQWFYFGVIVDAPHSQLLTYFSPSKEKFFSDIYNDIKQNLAGDLPMAAAETVVNDFFENNRNFHFNYMMIPLNSLMTGAGSGSIEALDIRF